MHNYNICAYIYIYKDIYIKREKKIKSRKKETYNNSHIFNK